MANVNGWWVNDNNEFHKGFIDYVVSVKQVNVNASRRIFTPKSINTILSDLPEPKVAVTIWKGSGHEETKHTVYYDNYEDAFNFVDEFAKQKKFDQVVGEYFK